MNVNKRIKWLDFAKGFTIICVIFSHTLSNVSNSPVIIQQLVKYMTYLLTLFIMPLFFAISGYLYKTIHNMYSYKILIYKKITSFIIPYIVFTLICVLPGFNNKAIIGINYESFYKTFMKLLVFPTSYLWFLYVLFFIFIFVGLMDLFRIPLYIQIIISCALMLIKCIYPYPLIIRHLCSMYVVNPSYIMGYLLCFYLGYIMKKYSVINHFKGKITLSASLFLCWNIIVLIQYILVGNNNVDAFNFIDVFSKLLSIFIFFIIFINLNEYTSTFQIIDKYGKYTLLIYLCHIPVSIIIMHFHLNRISSYFMINFISYYGFLTLILIFICYLSSHINIINFIFYPRKYINKFIFNKTRKEG